MQTFSVYEWNLDETDTANITLEECRNSIAGHFEQNPDAGCFLIIGDESEEIEEQWHWCETCGVYNAKHCPCVKAEIWAKEYWWL